MPMDGFRRTCPRRDRRRLHLPVAHDTPLCRDPLMLGKTSPAEGTQRAPVTGARLSTRADRTADQGDLMAGGIEPGAQFVDYRSELQQGLDGLSLQRGQRSGGG